MQIPKRLRIGSKVWKIVSDSTKFDSARLDGICVFRTRTIYLNNMIDRDEYEITYLHELLHALWPNNIITSKMEEKLVDKLSRDLHAVIKMNPGVIKCKNANIPKAKRGKRAVSNKRKKSRP